MRSRPDISGTSIIRLLAEEGRFVEIATTRPETLLGDTAVAVNPDDERYQTSDRKDAEASVDGPRDPGYRGRVCRQRVRYRLRKDHAGS